MRPTLIGAGAFIAGSLLAVATAFGVTAAASGGSADEGGLEGNSEVNYGSNG